MATPKQIAAAEAVTFSGDGAAFVVVNAEGQVFKFFDDGRIEGFGPDCIVFNRIPMIARLYVAEHRLDSIPDPTGEAAA